MRSFIATTRRAKYLQKRLVRKIKTGYQVTRADLEVIAEANR